MIFLYFVKLQVLSEQKSMRSNFETSNLDILPKRSKKNPKIYDPEKNLRYVVQFINEESEQAEKRMPW